MSTWLRRIMPRTLLVRTFLLIAVLMILSLLSWFAIFKSLEREPRARQMAQTLISIANLTRTSLVTAHPNARRYLLQELSDREGIHIYPVKDDDQAGPEDIPAFFTRTAELVREDLGPQTRFALELNGERALFVTFEIGDDEYWVALPRDRVERKLPQQWLDWSLAATALAMLGAWLVMFRVTRPLKALSEAARAIGQGRPSPTLPETGPAELRTVTHAFNQMSADLARMANDRAMVLAGISHDLRTPLTRLRMSVEMSAADATDQEAMVGDIEEIDKTISQFLDFARADDGEAFADTDLSTMLDELVARYARHGTTLAHSIAPGISLPVRPKALRRAVTNLLDNALKYASTDIALGLSREGGQLIISIADHGPGIPAEEVERMRQPFTRINDARSNAAGAGLGLAIVDRILQAHQGRLELLPNDGGGLLARLILPA